MQIREMKCHDQSPAAPVGGFRLLVDVKESVRNAATIDGGYLVG